MKLRTLFGLVVSVSIAFSALPTAESEPLPLLENRVITYWKDTLVATLGPVVVESPEDPGYFALVPPDPGLYSGEELAELLDLVPGTVEGGTDTVKPPDDRDRITTTLSFPWRTLVKIYITNAAGTNTGPCSGALVDGFHVLTAGHCVWPENGVDWNSDYRILPGMDNGWVGWLADNYKDRPLGNSVLGAAGWTNVRTYTAWTDSNDINHDWALITLDRNYGSITGAMGRFTAASTHSWYTGTLHTAGYPGDLDNGINQYYDSDTGCEADSHRHFYNMDTAGGQSGSAVWVDDAGSRYIGTVHAYGFNAGADPECNSGTRLNQDKYDRVTTWLGEDSAPTNKADLFELISSSSTLSNPVQSTSDFSPTVVKPGSTAFSASILVRNGGPVATGSYKVDFRVSSDTTVTTGDPLLGQATVSSTYLLANSGPSWSGTFPSGIADGVYNVGWIIDSQNQVAEYDDYYGANSGYKRGKTVRVDGTAPTGTVASPPLSLGAYSVTWSAQDTGAGLGSVQIDRRLTTSSSWSFLCSDSASGASDSGSCASHPFPPGSYCYRLRVWDAVGNTALAPLEACTTSLT